ncbi:MAG: BamA/TamA family outer membrane protein [Fibrobacteraceae bacterium]
MLRNSFFFLLFILFPLFAEEDSSIAPGNGETSDSLIIFDGTNTDTLGDTLSADSLRFQEKSSQDSIAKDSISEPDVGDSVVSESSKPAEQSYDLRSIFFWPFSHIIQPVLDAAVYPFAAPIHYAVKYNVVTTVVDAVSFGKEKNIFIYPTFNLKPGASTSIGFSYRHRNMLMKRDYFYGGANYFANGDYDLDTRYTKRNILGSDFFGGGRFQYWADRNALYVIPRTLSINGKNESFSYTDTSFKTSFRIGRPIPLLANMNFETSAGFENHHFSYPDIEDTILTNHPYFNPYDRGLYQDYYTIPLKTTVSYDNLDAPFVPTTGSRISITWTYIKVSDYSGPNSIEKSNEFSHDFHVLDFTAQHYFFLGRDPHTYGLSAEEARKNRKYYTDFSWDETLRLWRPENIKTTLLDRRVLAFQFQARQMWEKEKGGAPFSAFSQITARYPLRGYSYAFADYAAMGISAEYRWPIDRLVDGVLFDEYAMYGRTLHSFDSNHLLNSWGLGVRVRRPDMYLFRLQLGFHGMHGVSFICTIAPEFR